MRQRTRFHHGKMFNSARRSAFESKNYNSTDSVNYEVCRLFVDGILHNILRQKLSLPELSLRTNLL